MILQWTHFGSQKSIRLVELGPGRGTLMADILRVGHRIRMVGLCNQSTIFLPQVLSQISSARSAVQELHLVETSESMRKLQVDKLNPLTSSKGCEVHWHSSLDEVPVNKDMFTLVIAHEFFDALPFHLLQV